VHVERGERGGVCKRGVVWGEEQPEMTVYIFFREGFFYPVELRDDSDALACVPLNPGTIKVETALGRVVYPVPRESRQ
jgi:hypothetical protein